MPQHAHGSGSRPVILQHERLAEQIRVHAPNGLVCPEHFHQFMGGARCTTIHPVHMRIQGRFDGFGSAFAKEPLGLPPCPVFRHAEGCQQVFDRCIVQGRRFHQRLLLGGDAPDPSMPVIAARIPEVHLAMLDDRVVPVGEIQGPVRPHIYVHRPERHMIRPDQVFLFFG